MLSDTESAAQTRYGRIAAGEHVIWFIVFFVLTEGFGLRTESWGGLGTGQFFWFGLIQLLAVGLSLIYLPLGLSFLKRSSKYRLGAAVFLLSLLPLYMTVVTLIRVFFVPNASIDAVLYGVISLKFFLFVFVFAYLVSGKRGLDKAIAVTKLYAAITSAFTLFIVFFDVETVVTRVSTSTDVTRSFRVIVPGALLLGAGWILFASSYLAQGGIANVAGWILCLGATLIQLHRSSGIAVISALAIILLSALYRRINSAGFQRRKIILLLFAFIGGSLILYYIVAFWKAEALSYFEASLTEIAALDANSGHRVRLILNSWDYVLSDTLGLGLGFDWNKEFDFVTYLEAGFNDGPTFDSSYANIIIVSGIPGIILFAWLTVCLFSLNRGGSSRYKGGSHATFELFITPFVFYCGILAFGTDLVLIAPAAGFFVLILVTAVRFEADRKQLLHR